MAKKDTDYRETKYQSYSYMTLFTAFIAVFSLFLYAKQKDPAFLVYSFIVILVCLGLPLLMDFLKSAAVKGIESEASKNKKDDKVMDRIENLEALMCRLDTEINSQLEQTLSA